MVNPDNPAELPPALLAETTPLISLIHHRWLADDQLPLEELEKEFRERGVDYLALVRKGRVTGICSRAKLGALLGSRFGFSLYARSPAHLVQVAHPLVVPSDMPVRQLLDLALGRPTGDFREDVALVDSELGLVGLIPVEHLAHLQNRLVAEQVESLKTQHEALRRLERNAQRQEKQRLLDTLVGGIAHELNNKLTPILGLAELLSHESGAGLINHATLISRCAQEASRIIRQLLQLSKPDQFQMTAVDLGPVVEESLLMLKFKLREKQCEVATRIPPSRPLTLADTARLKQVVMNLVLNAIDAVAGQPNPRIEVGIAAVPRGLTITVADNGQGIPPEILSRIFDPFFTTKPPDQGTGLGLSICQSIIRQHNGEISVTSERGVGTAFAVLLPSLEGLAPSPLPPRPLLASLPPAAGKALVVDDEEPVRVVLAEMLRSSLHCAVDVAKNGSEGLALLARNDYDLMVCDIRMPEMSGPELYLQIQARFPALIERLVFITGHPGEKPLQEEMAQWGIPVLPKPFTLPRLMETCGPLLRRIVRSATH